MGFLSRHLKERFAERKPESLQADIRMFSGCEDAQTSADVSNVADFKLPDPAGRAGGACTSTMLNVLYKDNQTPEDTYSYAQLLEKMRQILKEKGFEQIPQLTASHPIDIDEDFSLVPPTATGTRRALLVGINYTGSECELSGCHNDVNNMITYLKEVNGFDDDNIKVLMDDGNHDLPTRDNMIEAYKELVALSEPGDAIFIHYSGHGAKVRDNNGDETDGYDETLCPVDYQEAGLIRDDDLYNVIIKPLRKGIHLVSVMDCCHSGTVLDLPYIYKPNGHYKAMEIDEGYNFNKVLGKLGHAVEGLLD